MAADIYCIIPQFLAYKVLKSSISVTIRFNQAEESKYVIMIPLENQYGRHYVKQEIDQAYTLSDKQNEEGPLYAEMDFRGKRVKLQVDSGQKSMSYLPS